MFPLSKIDQHEQQCGQVKCDNPLCRKQLEYQKFYEIVTSEGKLCVCNDICENLAKFHKIKKNKQYLDCLKFFQSTLSSGQSIGMKRALTDSEVAKHLVNNDDFQVVEKRECLSVDYIQKVQQNSKTNFHWDPNCTSDVIQLTALNRHIFLSEDTYLFRTAIGNEGFFEGTHYWELVADSRTENELKIGVVKNRDIDLKTAFSDYSCGWAYYATG